LFKAKRVVTIHKKSLSYGYIVKYANYNRRPTFEVTCALLQTRGKDGSQRNT